MSSSNSTGQFFPPILKRISIGFFAILFVCIVLIIYFSPQSLFQKDHQTKNAVNSQPQATITPPKGQALAQTTATPTPTAIPDRPSDSQGSITSEVDSPPVVTPIITPAPTPVPTQASKPDCSGNSKASIKGIIIGNNKFYFKKWMREYYRIEENYQVSRWFCSEGEAKAAGWVQAPNDLLSF